MRTWIGAGLMAIAASAFAQGPSRIGDETEHVPGHVLVRLAPEADPRDLERDLAFIDGRPTGLTASWEVSPPARIWLLRHDPALDAALVLERIRRHASVEVAQFDHVVHERITPNDTQFGQQWHHVDPQDNDIDTDLAWNTTTGGNTALGDTIVVCVVEGFDRSHSDLNGNAWVNRAEIDGNGVDDDANGYIDDVFGWNPSAGNDNTLFSGGHGTSCAGMVGARGNNANGVVGANWAVKMIPVRIGSLTESNVIASYTYPLVLRQRWNQTNGAQGAFVVATSSSWGIDNANPNNYPLWCGFYDTMGQAGILNCGATANNNVNVDVVGDMPTACSSPYMISVTATDANDQRTFSGYGLTTIDVGAPGASVRTTSSSNGYTTTSGTSFATPLTAGVIALMYSAPCTGVAQLARTDPQGAADAMRTALFAGVEQVGNLPGQTVTGGRINANNSVQYVMTNCATYSPAITLDAKVLLEGAYVEASGLMRDDLRTQGLLPLVEPYTAAGIPVVGNTTATTTAPVLAVTGANAIVDWVLLELRDATVPSTVLRSRTALVQRDGDIVAVDGTSPVSFDVSPGTYHVAVRHRNHLGVMTATAPSLGAGVTALDLTAAATPTWGTDARKSLGTVQLLWAGNALRDDRLKYAGSANDRDPVLTAIGGTVPTATLNGQYRPEDVNLDGVVKYAGGANDRDPILVNIGGTVPTATRQEQLP
ncbi:MAG: S8 family serine peptidase [Flavobacteriales bacterium]|nr:S8 family serine peptidase [Flavobacteriales bacterium]